MGREIRLVKPGWEHPKGERNWGIDYMPLYDEDFASAAKEWRDLFAKWEGGERQKHLQETGDDEEFWEWHGTPPDRAYYRPAWTEAEAIHFQMYETVSEGTPVSPVFATKEELVDYLVANGDFWDQKRGNGGWKRDAAEKFVGCGYAPSMIVIRSAAGVEIKEPRDGI
jgi:hypothetical protein